MEKYTVLELLGEGSYGKVLKCRHNDTGTMVAIKKFIETEEDSGARKVALREIRMLKKLHHPNLVCLLEVFRRKKRFHLVFEFMACSLLEELEAQGSFSEELVRRYMYQILRGIDYCHSHNIIHRDIKPENILISDMGIVKLCDFGFARFATVTNEPLTDYVATRWYRPPELLVGDTSYGRAVDIWALGCIQIEMLTGEPLFPGNSDIDQLYHISKLLGSLTESQKMLIGKYSTKEQGGEHILEHFEKRLKLETYYCLRENFSGIDWRTLEFAAHCLRLDPDARQNSEQLLRHHYFTWDLFLNQYVPELQRKVHLELARRVSVSDLPCPPAAEAVYNYDHPTSFTRKPSKNTLWTLNTMGSARDNYPFFKEYSREKKQTENSLSQDAATKSGSSATHTTHKPATDEQMDWKETDKGPSEMPKISLEFKRNMMPSSQTYLRPVKGRLYYDKYLTLPCSNEAMEKPQYEGIYLPLIKTLPDLKTVPDKTDGYHLKRKKSSQKDKEKPKSKTNFEENLPPQSDGRRKARPAKKKNHFPEV